jgi:hypothetical protein
LHLPIVLISGGRGVTTLLAREGAKGRDRQEWLPFQLAEGQRSAQPERRLRSKKRHRQLSDRHARDLFFVFLGSQKTFKSATQNLKPVCGLRLPFGAHGLLSVQ